MNVPTWIVTILVALIGGMAVLGLDNNTLAMCRLADSLDRIERRIGMHDIALENHEVRLTKGGL